MVIRSWRITDLLWHIEMHLTGNFGHMKGFECDVKMFTVDCLAESVQAPSH